MHYYLRLHIDGPTRANVLGIVRSIDNPPGHPWRWIDDDAPEVGARINSGQVVGSDSQGRPTGVKWSMGGSGSGPR